LKTKNEACHYPASLVVYMFIHYAHTIIRLPIIRQVMMMVMMCNNIFHTILLFWCDKSKLSVWNFQRFITKSFVFLSFS